MREFMKYQNRQMKDRRTKKPVNEGDVQAVIESGEEVSIMDEKTGEDITRAVLLEIFKNKQLHRPNGGVTVAWLHQMIR